MNYLDIMIPFVILGAVGGFVFFLLRRVSGEKDAPPARTETPIVKAEPVVVIAPEPVTLAKFETPALNSTKVLEEINSTVVPAAPIVVPPQPATKSAEPVVAMPKKKRKRLSVPAATTPKGQTPIVTVMGLLKEKDSLATAFLLREILAPPVSKR